MQIIGNNISNANTIGYKSSDYCFEDLLSQSISTQSGSTQVGRGSAISTVDLDFTQGSFENTGNATDLAIGGDGFFKVVDPDSGSTYYTRAGNFEFDKEGNLVTSDGYIVQGWSLDENGEAQGSVTDIILGSFTSPPQASEIVTLITNLDADSTSNTADLASSWDATNDPVISSESYEYQTTLAVYDSLGSQHDITVYYDKSDTADSTWEYIVTCSPSEDNRAGFATTTYQGLLASGTIEFSESSGSILDLTMNSVDPATGAWTAGTVDTNGYYEFSANFLGGATTDMSIELDLGTRFDGTVWDNSSLSSTQYAKASTTTYQTADGYGSGDLQDIDVDSDGVITGVYSNGEIIPLYQLALADFLSPQGLYSVGGNLFRETRDSGTAITNVPGTSGLGSISPNSYEQSNVDIATEFVNMITIQRAYQANSKIITTLDAMLSETIDMKR
jgi:flagellar hook protein FlgE